LIIGEDGEISARLHPYEIINRATLTMDDPEKLDALRKQLTEISFNVEVDGDFTLVDISG
jgi:hypothetical protein